ncbi:uncharacterized protein MKK02DRAFT_44963 [Dioszegia hungarica]|uniref:Uncharacterized protein n=1 Tax=Dioszegia hungarica TaxID=4972 RepID=A0AA38H957_9TREE|nr:uncharacterized protein MKK02DRAFT_44963 [Dioszegia hungarica]KAI9636258.1 hypothetical protein MKK02DRAFT_44963 [Dioszegia hungarica]
MLYETNARVHDNGRHLDLSQYICIGLIILISFLLLIYILFVRCRYLRRRTCSKCGQRVQVTGRERIEGFWQRVWHDTCWRERTGTTAAEEGRGAPRRVHARTASDSGQTLVSPRRVGSYKGSPLASPTWTTTSPASYSPVNVTLGDKGLPSAPASTARPCTGNAASPPIPPAQLNQAVSQIRHDTPLLYPNSNSAVATTQIPHAGPNIPYGTPFLILNPPLLPPPRGTSMYVDPYIPRHSFRTTTPPRQMATIHEGPAHAVPPVTPPLRAHVSQEAVPVMGSHTLGQTTQMGTSRGEVQAVLSIVPPRESSRAGVAM